MVMARASKSPRPREREPMVMARASKSPRPRERESMAVVRSEREPMVMARESTEGNYPIANLLFRQLYMYFLQLANVAKTFANLANVSGEVRQFGESLHNIRQLKLNELLTRNDSFYIQLGQT